MKNEEFKSDADSYASRAEETAKKNGVDAEDIVRHDANLENSIRDGKTDLRKDLQEKIINSDLILKPDENRDDIAVLEGGIEGKKVSIKVELEHRTHSSFVKNILDAKIDGEPLDHETAKQIYNEYKRVAELRQGKIDRMAEDRRDEQKKLEDTRNELKNM